MASRAAAKATSKATTTRSKKENVMSDETFRPQPKTSRKPRATAKAKAAPQGQEGTPVAKAPAKEKRASKAKVKDPAPQVTAPVTPPPTPQPNGNFEADLEVAATALRGGAHGQLVFGALLHKWQNEGRNIEDIGRLLLNRGVSIPARSRRSMWQQTWVAWVADAGMSLDQTYFHETVKADDGTQAGIQLTSVSIDKLYYLKDEVTPENAVELLAWAFNHTDAEARDRKRGEREARPKTTETLKVDIDLYDLILGVTDRVRSVEGQPRIGIFDVMRFAMAQFVPSAMDDDTLDLLWRKEHGDLTEAEMAAFTQRGEELRQEGVDPNPDPTIGGMTVAEVLEAVDAGQMDPFDVLQEEIAGRNRKLLIKGLNERLMLDEEGNKTPVPDAQEPLDLELVGVAEGADDYGDDDGEADD